MGGVCRASAAGVLRQADGQLDAEEEEEEEGEGLKRLRKTCKT